MTVPKNMRPLKSEEVDNLSTSIQSMVSRVDEKKSVLMRLLTELVQQYVFDSRKTSIERNIKIVNKIVEKNAKNIQLAFQDGITEKMISEVVESATKGRTSNNEIRKNLSKLVKDSIEKKLVSDSDEKQIFKIEKDGKIIAASAVSSLSSSFLNGLNSYVSSSIRTKVKSTIQTQLSNKLKVTGTIHNNVGVKATLSKYGTIASNLVRGKYKLNPSVFKKDTKDKISTTRITKSSDQIGVFKNLMGKVFSHQNKEVKTTISSVLEKGTTKILVFFFGPIGFLAVGAFKLLTTLTRIGTFILKTALKTVGFVIKGVSKVVGGIFRGLTTLATSTVKLIGKTISLIYSTMTWSIQKMLPLIKTPAGMFILGYIAGFFYKHVILRLLPKGSIGELTKRIADMVWGVYMNTKTRILGAMSEEFAKVSEGISGLSARIDIDKIKNCVDAYKNFLNRNDVAKNLDLLDSVTNAMEDVIMPALTLIRDTVVVGATSVAGAAAGAKLGGLIGSFFPGLGNVIGAAIGGLLGSFIGASLAENFLDKFRMEYDEKKAKIRKFSKVTSTYSTADDTLGSLFPSIMPKHIKSAGKVKIDDKEQDAAEYYKNIQDRANELDMKLGIGMSDSDADFVSNVAQAIDNEFNSITQEMVANRGIDSEGYANLENEMQKKARESTFISTNPDDYKTGDYSNYSNKFSWFDNPPRNDYVMLRLMRAVNARQLLTNVKSGKISVSMFRKLLQDNATKLPVRLSKRIEEIDNPTYRKYVSGGMGPGVMVDMPRDRNQDLSEVLRMRNDATEIDTSIAEKETTEINSFLSPAFFKALKRNLEKEKIDFNESDIDRYRAKFAMYLKHKYYQGELNDAHRAEIAKTLFDYVRETNSLMADKKKLEIAVNGRIETTGSKNADTLLSLTTDIKNKLTDVSNKLGGMKTRVSQQAMDRQIRLAKEKQALRDKKNKEKLLENTVQEAGSMKKSIRKMVDEKKNQKSAPSVTIIGSGEKDHDPDAE
jgi:hypothetical protein